MPRSERIDSWSARATSDSNDVRASAARTSVLASPGVGASCSRMSSSSVDCVPAALLGSSFAEAELIPTGAEASAELDSLGAGELLWNTTPARAAATVEGGSGGGDPGADVEPAGSESGVLEWWVTVGAASPPRAAWIT